MKDAGIFDNDVLIVTGPRNWRAENYCSCTERGIDGKALPQNFSSTFLVPENDRYKTINLGEFSDFMLWV